MSVFFLKIKGKKIIFNASVKKGQISNTAEGEKKEVSCLFPSLTFWNPEEGGKNPPKSRLERKERKGKKGIAIQ